MSRMSSQEQTVSQELTAGAVGSTSRAQGETGLPRAVVDDEFRGEVTPIQVETRSFLLRCPEAR